MSKPTPNNSPEHIVFVYQETNRIADAFWDAGREWIAMVSKVDGEIPGYSMSGVNDDKWIEQGCPPNVEISLYSPHFCDERIILMPFEYVFGDYQTRKRLETVYRFGAIARREQERIAELEEKEEQQRQENIAQEKRERELLRTLLERYGQP